MRISVRLSPAAALLAAIVAAAPLSAELPASNPFAAPSPLLYQAPQFDRIKDADYLPAIEEGMKRQLAEIDAIANNPEPPTFDNTIVAMERSGQLLTRVAKVFFNLDQSNTNDALQKIEADVAPEARRAQGRDLPEPEALRARQGALRQARHARPRRREQVPDRALPPRTSSARARSCRTPTRRAFARLNQEESTLTTEFVDKLLAATNAAAVVVDDRKRARRALRGRRRPPRPRPRRSASSTASGSSRCRTRRSSRSSPRSRTGPLRQRVFEASVKRGEHGGPNDTRAIVARLAQLRAQQGEAPRLPDLRGLRARRPDGQDAAERAMKLLTDLVPAATAQGGRGGRADAEADRLREGRLQARPRRTGSSTPRRCGRREYDLDEAELKPYFELDRVLQDGVFFAANQLYGITFKERKDLPVYQPDVRVFEVFDADGKSLALYYGDYFQRVQQERRGVVRQLRRPGAPARDEAGRRQRHQLHEAGSRRSRRCSPSTT